MKMKMKKMKNNEMKYENEIIMQIMIWNNK